MHLTGTPLPLVMSTGGGRHPLIFSREPEPAKNVWEAVGDIVGGTGASVSSTGDSRLDQALLRRMRYQDKAVMLLLFCAYIGSLLFSASLAYRQAANDSPVTYYADPRYQDLMFEGHDFEGFLETFNQQPKDCHLQVTGLLPLAPFPEHVVESAVEWLGGHYRVAFSFALDLSPWVVRNGLMEADPPSSGGVLPEDIEVLNSWLSNNRNDLACVHMEKQIEWKSWEELATNIKSKIRQSGFQGIVSVTHRSQENFTVYKNRLWANFMHSQTTKVLCALSLFGWFFYQPYMWLRQRSITVKCKYRIDVSIDQYWALISDKLGPQGFDAEGGVEAAAPSPAPRM